MGSAAWLRYGTKQKVCDTSNHNYLKNNIITIIIFTKINKISILPYNDTKQKNMVQKNKKRT